MHDELGHPRLEHLYASAQPRPAGIHLEGLESAAHGEHQLLVVERLGQVVAGSEAQRLEHVPLIGLGRDDHHPRLGVVAAQPAQHLDAAQAGQPQVEDDGADGRIAGDAQRLLAVGRRVAAEPGRDERVPDRFAEEALVVDDENARVLGQGDSPQRMKRDRSSSSTRS